MRTNKPCEYCGADLPLGVDKTTRRARSHHFAHCEKRPSVGVSEAETNARLTDAAPALKEALESVLGRLEWLNDPRTGNTEAPWVKEAQRALALCT